jgi:hypothetical protein
MAIPTKKERLLLALGIATIRLQSLSESRAGDTGLMPCGDIHSGVYNAGINF